MTAQGDTFTVVRTSAAPSRGTVRYGDACRHRLRWFEPNTCHQLNVHLIRAFALSCPALGGAQAPDGDSLLTISHRG